MLGDMLIPMDTGNGEVARIIGYSVHKTHLLNSYSERI